MREGAGSLPPLLPHLHLLPFYRQNGLENLLDRVARICSHLSRTVSRCTLPPPPSDADTMSGKIGPPKVYTARESTSSSFAGTGICLGVLGIRPPMRRRLKNAVAPWPMNSSSCS